MAFDGSPRVVRPSSTFLKMCPDTYYERFGFCEGQIAAPPHPELGLVVVIPCFNEPDLIGSLGSLWNCDRPAGAVEVIVVLNSPASCDAAVREQNERSFQKASDWIAQHPDPRLSFHLLHLPDLPPKHAGVGLARKIGMDEAARRFDQLGKPRGIIVGFDADCQCDANYLTAIERHFLDHPRCPGCSVYFEHPLEGSLEAEVYDAIAAYELHLRFYNQALRYAGFPHAHHTLGSCMAVRANVYKSQGGMNRRQAGEDFYFLQKIIPLGAFADLTATRVIPSPRPSDRVPFGTGKAVLDALREGKRATYPLEAFLDLRTLFLAIPALCDGHAISNPDFLSAASKAMRSFLDKEDFVKSLQEIRQNTANEATFRSRFFRWFNAFRAMKFVHHARDYFYGEPKVGPEAVRLLQLVAGDVQGLDGMAVRDLLAIYRALERKVGNSQAKD
ncbi:MAG: glycosyltransferase family 2 protein [Verrucomicrobia bacterium]|nr:glycosyltransferase family 2 protein [Verrucomicrobiota bacterium]